MLNSKKIGFKKFIEVSIGAVKHKQNTNFKRINGVKMNLQYFS
jgi:hypothetical protein